MTTCTDCAASRLSNGLWRLFNPACLWCGARLIKQIGALPIAQSEATKRRKAVLATWVEHGHPEAELRSLAKGPLPLEPVPDTLPSAKARTGKSSTARAGAAR